MELLANLAFGMQVALLPINLFYCFVGVTLGTFIGVLPGIGALATVSMLLPVTFYLEPTTALVMLAGVYYGAEYGGSISAILLNLPGTPQSAVTCLDGHPLARQGRAGMALFVTTVASFVGAALGIVLLILFSPLLAQLTLAFRPADYFAIMVLGLIAAATMSRGSPLNGMAMVVLGLLLGCVGTDVNTGVPRYNLGFPELFNGINLIALAMGLFGVAEVIDSVNIAHADVLKKKITLRSMLPTGREMRQSFAPMLRGSGIGSFFGALPGTGQTISCFMSYALEKRLAREPEQFGKGAVQGIASPEAANNAAIQTAFIPTLTMGIPGSASMALMLGALMIQGIVPGPSLMREHADVFWGLIASFWIGNIMLVILNIPLIGIWIKLLQIPYRFLYPAIICLICIGVYSISRSAFDIALVFVFGVAGYAMRLIDFEPAPLLLGFILGPMMEENLRRALLLSHGDPLVFMERPVSAGLLAISIGLIVWATWRALTRRRPAQRSSEFAMLRD